MSYLSENEAKNLQNGNIRFTQIPDFGMGYLENNLANKVRDGPFFCIFHSLKGQSSTAKISPVETNPKNTCSHKIAHISSSRDDKLNM